MAASEDLFAGLEHVGAQTERADPEVVAETRPDPEVTAKPAELFAGLEHVGGGKSAYQEPESTETQSGDAWKATKAGFQKDVIQPLTSGLGYLARGAGAENVETIMRNLGASSRETEEENLAELSPAARKSVQASIFDPEFTSNIARGIGYKGVNMIPGIIAQIAPALLFSNPVTATAAVAATGAAFGGGSYIQQINDSVDKATPEMLATVPLYKKARDAGASEDEARARLKDEVLGNGPLINAIVGAAVNAAGPMGALARTASGGAGSLLAAGRTLPGRLATGAAEGSVLNAGQAGVAEVTRQTALVDNGLQDGYDLIQGAKSVGEAGVVGGVMGTAAGAFSAGHPSTARPQPEVGRGITETRAAEPATAPAAEPAKTTPAGVEVVSEKDPGVAEAAALIASNPPAAPKDPTIARDVTPDEVVPASEKVAPRAPAVEPGAAKDVAAAAAEAPAATVVRPSTPDDLFSGLEHVVPNGKGGRILQAIDPEAEHNLAAQRAEQAANLASLDVKAPAEREAKTAEDYSPKDAKRRDERDRQATVAETIFDAVPERVYPKTEGDRQTLSKELGKVLDIAKSEKINVAKIKGNETQSDHMIWLRDAYDLKKILDKKNTTQKAREERDSRLLSFLSDEKIAKETGDFSSMRERRRVEGEEKMGRKGKGSDIDQVADTTTEGIGTGAITPDETPEVGGDVTLRGNEAKLGTEDVATAKPESDKSGIRGINAPGFGEGGIYGAGKKVEISEADKAKYNTPGVAAAKERIAAAAEKTRTTKKAAFDKETTQRIKPKLYGDLNPEERAAFDKKLNDENFAKIQKIEPGLTREEYEKRRAGGNAAAIAFLNGKLEKPTPKKETVVESAKRSAAEEAELAKLMGEQAAEQGAGSFNKREPSNEEVLGALKELNKIGEEPIGRDVLSRSRNDDAVAGGPTTFTAPGVRGSVKTIHTEYASKILKHLDFSGFPKDTIAGKLLPFVAKHIQQYMHDVKVHFVDGDAMGKITGDDKALGYFWSSHSDPKKDFILININDHRNTAHATHTIVHEAIHAATVRELVTSPHFKAMIRRLMDQVEYWHDGDEAVMGYHSNGVRRSYGLTNEGEFLAEAFSNPRFQELLARIPLSEYDARMAGLHNKIRPTLWDHFVAMISKLLRVGDEFKKGEFSALEGILRVGKDMMAVQETRRQLSHLPEYRPKKGDKFEPIGAPSFRRGDALEHTREVVTNFATNSGSHTRKLKNSLSSFGMLTQRAEHVLPGSDVVLKAMQEMETERHRILTDEGGLKITQQIADHEREHGVESRQKVTDLGFAASEANVNLGAGANNAHLGKDATKGWQAKARLKDLQARYDGLLPHEKKLFDEVGAYYRKVQNDLSLQLIKNTLADLQFNEPGLAERIHREGLTDADKEKLKTNTAVNALNEMRELKKIEGYYLPFARYGDFVVNSYSKLEAPKGAVKVNGQDDTVRFVGQGGSDADARNRARVFVEDHNLKHIDTKQVWVDKLDPSRTLEPEHTRAVPAYDVTMQRQSTQFFENEAEARRVQMEMDGDKAALGLEKVDGVVRKYDFMAKNPDGLSGHMATVWSALEKQAKYQRMSSDERAAVRQTLNEATLRLRGPTRLQSQFLQRRNVAGYSTDAGRVTANYARASAGYLARLRKQPALDAAFDTLKKYINDHKFESNDRTVKRSEFYNEMLKRTYEQEPVDQTALGRVSKRLLQISRLDKLAGVSFHVINAQEPWTTSLPVIGGRHGMIRAGRALAQAYNMIGGRGALSAGLRDTMKAYRTDGGFTDYLQMFKDNIASSPAMGDAKKSRFGDLIDYLDKRGIVSDSAVFEVDRYSNPSSNVVGRALDRADLMANQVGTAVEKINRVVTAIAAYDLEFNRTGNHEGAMHYAYEVTHDTMGDYSTWNSPSAFKTPLGALALQFKKFALKSYYLLGKTMQGAIAGDREAAKQFIGLMATHAIVAGAMGVPGLEPFKVALMASNVLGISGFSWEDFELAVRAKSAELLGQKGGEVLSKGVYRLAGVEVSSRLGMDNLITQPGGIRDPQKVDDIYAYLAKTVFGAPAAYLLDQAKMAQALQKGDLMKAAELAIPLKSGSDVLKAIGGQSPRLDAKGREINTPYTPYETALRAIGFQPSSEAENFAKRAGIAAQTKKQTTARTTMIDGWVNAKGGGKDAQLKAIQQWNKDNPTNQAIGMKDLLRAQQLRKDNPTGMKKTDRNANVYDRLAPIFGN